MATTTVKISKAHQQLIDDIASQRDWRGLQLKNLPLGQALLSASAAERKQFVLSAIEWLYDASDNVRDAQYHQRCVGTAVVELLHPNLAFDDAELVTVVGWAVSGRGTPPNYGAPQLFKLLDSHLAQHTLTPELQEVMEYLIKNLESADNPVALRKWAAKLRALGIAIAVTWPLLPGEAWTDAALQGLNALPTPAQKNWSALLLLCASATAAKPIATWLKQAEAALTPIGKATFKASLLKWFAMVDKPRTQLLDRWGVHGVLTQQLMADENAHILRGLIWLCAKLGDTEITRALTAVALSAYRKLPGHGPRAVKVGNACIWALGQSTGVEGVRQLTLLNLKVKFGTAQKEIEKALIQAAERLQLPREELEELTAPTYGLEADGTRRETWGEWTAELAVVGTHEVELRWRKADGKTQTSVPKAVKDNFAAELKELKQTASDIEKMLPAQRDRIENVYLAQQTWDYATWRERYLEHPLVGTLARRLIWSFSNSAHTESGIWHEGRMVTAHGVVLDWLDDTTTVALWHPINEPIQGVLAWRHWLDEQLVQQPFKQAHRELYLLTEAERRTQTYSNRFAAHILKQHQFNALCAARGWKNKLRLMVDDTYPPATRLLPKYNLRAEFWVEGIGDNYGEDTNEAGTYLYLTTDQVRFYALDAAENLAHAGGGGYSSYRGAEPLRIEDVPPLVLTEIMRDVDLFVGVASVGNDPTWTDGRAVGQPTAYWRDFSFGALSEVAKTRKQVLERLLPRLKIANRCELLERFLVVRGDLRTYKIHLGSGNILMSPNDQYLCIVPARGAGAATTSKVFLPFEGDQTLAIILSKAFLLVEDTQITDPTILRQLQELGR